jgi:hypothetical protein
MSTNQDAIKADMTYKAIARNLREFGYSDVTEKMILDVHQAMIKDEDIPHGIIGMFAKDQLEEADL